MWDEIEGFLKGHGPEAGQNVLPWQRAYFEYLKNSGLRALHATKYLVYFETPSGQRLLWEIRSPGNNFFVAAHWENALTAHPFSVTPKPYIPGTSGGGRQAGLGTFHGFGQQHCLCVQIKDIDDLQRLLSVLEVSTASKAKPLYSRDQIEGAIDAYIAHHSGTKTDPLFADFGRPTEYWLRSTRDRQGVVIPSKPVHRYLSRQPSSGGWGEARNSAAVLHNCGYVIVDENDVPHPPPDRDFLIKGADRIRLYALNYLIVPAREQGRATVTIIASDLAKAIGLQDQFPNICQALSGPLFQTLAQVPPPEITGPNPSSTTSFTFALGTSASAPERPSVSQPALPTNLILYGPPGTGKTYRTAEEAVRLCGLEVPKDRAALMAIYHDLCAAGRIAFVTFHQSMSYEDFVEGRQPVTGSGDDDEASQNTGFRLETMPGIFRRICTRAATSRGKVAQGAGFNMAGRGVFKFALGDACKAADNWIYEEAVARGVIMLGGEKFDWSDASYSNPDAILAACQPSDATEPPVTKSSKHFQHINAFRNDLKIGDLVVINKGIGHFRAIGEVVGEYTYHADADYPHQRAVKWLWQDDEGLPVNEIFGNNLRMGTIYRLASNKLNPAALTSLIDGAQADPAAPPEDFVLIIDEINRANISKVFGELITLIEPDKRLGQANALHLTLPYSGDRFGVPSNLHIIGTMNTADRSIALLDTALRRRFTFQELMPDPDALPEEVDGIKLRALLRRLNAGIEYLFDRDHQIGHAYFTGCKTEADIQAVMREKVIPLLAEYFYEDWAQVAAVLGDSEEGEARFFTTTTLQPLSGMPDSGPKTVWRLRSEPFDIKGFIG